VASLHFARVVSVHLQNTDFTFIWFRPKLASRYVVGRPREQPASALTPDDAGPTNYPGVPTDSSAPDNDLSADVDTAVTTLETAHLQEFTEQSASRSTVTSATDDPEGGWVHEPATPPHRDAHLSDGRPLVAVSDGGAAAGGRWREKERLREQQRTGDGGGGFDDATPTDRQWFTRSSPVHGGALPPE
jgi:hypothetical protein